MLSIPTMIVPPAPGVLSAFGLLVSRIEHDHTRTFAVKADAVDLAQLGALFDELDTLGQARMRADRVAPEAVQVARFADLRYVGQSYELEVPLPLALDGTTIARAVTDFHALHRQVYGHSRPQQPVEFVNIRTVHQAPLAPLALTPRHSGGSLDDACKGQRPAYFDEYRAYHETPVYDRYRLPIDVPVHGPAIVEQSDTTTVIYPQQVAQVDAAGNLIIRDEAGAEVL
jgi:N-methylhydantoinase A